MTSHPLASVWKSRQDANVARNGSSLSFNHHHHHHLDIPKPDYAAPSRNNRFQTIRHLYIIRLQQATSLEPNHILAFVELAASYQDGKPLRHRCHTAAIHCQKLTYSLSLSVLSPIKRTLPRLRLRPLHRQLQVFTTLCARASHKPPQ